jgi:hypothetical protein
MATFYVRTDGTALKAAAVGPSSDSTACMSVTTFNAATFSAGDIVYFSGLGGDFTEAVVIPSSGSSGNPIYYIADPASAPTIDGADTIDTLIDVNSKNYVEISGFTLIDAVTTCYQSRGTSTGVVVRDVTASGSGNQAFQNLDTASTTYYDIVGSGCADDGFSMHSGAVAVIHGATFSGNDQGINIIQNSSLTANDVTLTGNTSYGFWQTVAGATVSVFNRLTCDDLIKVDTGTCTINYSTHIGTVQAQGGNITFNHSSVTGSVTVLVAASTIAFSHCSYNGLANTGAVGGTLTFSKCRMTNTGNNNVVDCTNASSPAGNISVSYCIFTGIMATRFGIINRAPNITTAYNNVFYGVGGVGRGIFHAGVMTVNNNIMVGLQDTIFTVAGRTGTYSNNCFFGNTATITGAGGTQSNGVTSDPTFANPSGGYFALLSGSPCLAAGVVVGLPSDFIDAAVPFGATPSIGAYEQPVRRALGMADGIARHTIRIGL